MHTEPIHLLATRCAICGTESGAVELYPANFDLAAFSPAVFSARRVPDRLHYRMVRCEKCGLVRSDPVAEAGLLARLYAKSAQTYDEELGNLRKTYGRYLKALEKFGVKKESLLEIGCGSGFFLEEALSQGYLNVSGVEPSESAQEKASTHLKNRIVCDIMRPGLFPARSMDVICMFQVFDHMPDPNGVLAECRRLLKPGGLVLCLNHDVNALTSRILKERSPIIDIEHTYLYDQKTIAQIFRKQQYQVLRTGSVHNTYTLLYLMQLVPLPISMKKSFLSFLRSSLVGRSRFSVPLGNLFVVARTANEGK